MDIWNKLNIYRITHIDNLELILKEGLVAQESSKSDSCFKCIGNRELIEQRKLKSVPDPPGGVLNEYIPFYFGKRQPMLYQIATGWGEVEKIDQEEIIYLIISIGEIVKNSLPFFFSDGHIMTSTSKFYTELRDLDKLDWDAINSNNWSSDYAHLRRKEKKQAEFLVKNKIPICCVSGIMTYNKAAYDKVLLRLSNKKLSISIDVSKEDEEYYYDFLRNR